MKGKVLFSFKHDIRPRAASDWIRAHTALLKPLHRYVGTISLDSEKVTLKARDTRTTKSLYLEIPRRNILGVEIGGDEVFRRSEDRGLAYLQPLRLRYTERGAEETLYLFVDFHLLTKTTKNRQWLKAIDSTPA